MNSNTDYVGLIEYYNREKQRSLSTIARDLMRRPVAQFHLKNRNSFLNRSKPSLSLKDGKYLISDLDRKYLEDITGILNAI